MKTYLMAAVFVCGALISAQANLLTNPNFDLDINGDQQTNLEVAYAWANVQAWEGTADTRADRDDRRGEAHLTAPMAGDIGTSWTVGSSGSYIRQDSGVVAVADTQYKFSIDLDAAGIWKAIIGFETAEAGSWGAVGGFSKAFEPTPNAWVNYSIVLDTAVQTEFIGENIGVIVKSLDADGGFLQATNASLEVIPEPATFGLMGIAGLGLFLARRKSSHS